MPRLTTIIDQKLAEIHSRPGFLERVAAATPTPIKAPGVDLSTVWSKNPFSLRHRNITMQMVVMKSDRRLADRLRADAEKIDAAL